MAKSNQKVCRACLAAETFRPSTAWRPGKGDAPVSSLGKDGLCTNRRACEERAPILFSAKEMDRG